MPIHGHGEGNGFVGVKRRRSIFLSLSRSITDYRRMIHSLDDEMRYTTEGDIVIGDFNARVIDKGMLREGVYSRDGQPDVNP